MGYHCRWNCANGRMGGNGEVMRLYNSFSGRPANYDRNPTVIGNQNLGTIGVAPHTATNVWTYTVPAGRKASVEAGSNSVERVTAAAPVGAVQSWLGGAPPYADFISTLLNNVGSRIDHVLAGAVLLVAGNTFSGGSFDGSTGGTVMYVQTFQGTEFDA